MYELLVKSHFDAAHFLRGYPGKCRELHGHTWKVEVVVGGEKLNEIGLVYDFRELKSKLSELLSRFDHKYLNEIPPFDEVSPTGENLTKYLFDELRKVLPKEVSLKRVSVWESDDACLSYYG
ncbi:MAG: 6-carboxytetrahydropterin synthase QueD [Actinomycetota bacterium]|nr:6-carboxytetrahydropterin synthase QueD [Actinomycetota bacterium]